MREVIWQQYRLCLAVAEDQSPGGEHVLIPGPESGKIWWLVKIQHLQKYHCQWTLLRGRRPKWIFHSHLSLYQPRVSIWNRDQEDLAWADSGRNSLETSSFWAVARQKIGDQTFAFLIVLDGAISHLTAYPCKSTSPSEVIAKLHEWMDTFQMNPKAICADMAFHQPPDMQAFHRMHNVKRLPTGPHTPWPNRAEMGVRLFKKFLLALVDTASKNLDQTTLAQITLDQQGSNGEKYTGDLLVVRRPWKWPWDEDHEISWTQHP